MADPQPRTVEIRAYQMGFGDCFLLSVSYTHGPGRHVLIDFGSTRLPPEADRDHMTRVAESIREHVGEEPFAVVATHRHKDHISGFSTDRGQRSGGIIAGLRPQLVVQPWTEDPGLAVDATGPVAGLDDGRRRMAGTVRSLSAMQRVSANYLSEVRRNHQYMRSVGEKLKEQIEFIGDDNISNLSAVTNLIEMGRAGKAEYLHAEQPTALSEMLGADVRVLGPPTVDQDARVRRQRPRDEGEFWQLAARAADAVTLGEKRRARPLFPDHVVARTADQFPVAARWIVRRMREMRAKQILQIVRTLDRAMNNTSLILLFRIGSKSFLFPGDAQIENWQFALDDPDVMRLLSEVDVYKVGHHGSLNATPRTLWRTFERKSADPDAPRRLQTLLSTMANVHGHAEDSTEVPRASLVTELTGQSSLKTTQSLGPDDLYHLTRVDVQ